MWHLRPAELEKEPAHWEQLKSFSLVAFPPDLKINYKLYRKPDVPIILVLGCQYCKRGPLKSIHQFGTGVQTINDQKLSVLAVKAYHIARHLS
jgi:hypothetical protein